MLVREAMTAPAVAIAPSATVRQAMRVLLEHDVTALPVADRTGRLLGIVSEMDLLLGAFEADPRAFARPPSGGPSAPEPRTVEQVMTRDVRTARPTTDVAELAEMMPRTRIKSVPVVDGPAIVGVISRRDLIAALARSDARIRDDVLASIAAYAPDGGPWDVTVEDGVVRLTGRDDEQAERIVEVLARTVPGATRVLISPSP
ncbi:CBS domain-containing protein [Actinomadura sp. NPDC048394]|jgi:CBS domain-containing protein|uniref:CBS domain-containing protein n=1 Tax=Actinomadura sp. NPDC048394 TaxID=3158223 RepID=UPI0033E62B1B